MKDIFYKRVDKALRSIEQFEKTEHQVGIILGTGLGDFADQIDGQVIPFSKIDTFPESYVTGHRGFLKLCNKIAIFAGRFHYYEGCTIEDVVLPVFMFYKMGVKKLIITNASGAINPSFSPGNIVLIKDHINLMGVNPLKGPNNKNIGPRFPDMTDAYSKRFRTLAKGLGICKLKEGVYAAVSGPNYETPSEVRMLRKFGIDMVGMSTVPEVIAASYLKMEVLGISYISNMGAGIAKKRLSHERVIEVSKKVIKVFKTLLLKILSKLGCS